MIQKKESLHLKPLSHYLLSEYAGASFQSDLDAHERSEIYERQTGLQIVPHI